MSNFIINPWEMGEEINATTIPSFVEGRFMLVKVAPPKGKTIRDGLVATLAMISYKEQDGKDVNMVEVSQTPQGYVVELPFGKRGILATKYRGPKSWYRFFNNQKQKFYQIGKNDPKTKINDRLTLEYAEDYLSINVKGWDKMQDIEKDLHIDEYFENMYMFGLAKDFNLEVEANDKEVPTVGMVSNFYRNSTPPKEGEKYPTVIVTKFAPREGKETLSGEYTKVDPAIALAIYGTITTTEAVPTFDPTTFDVDDEDAPF
jgi:hypothetical protein